NAKACAGTQKEPHRNLSAIVSLTLLGRGYRASGSRNGRLGRSEAYSRSPYDPSRNGRTRGKDGTGAPGCLSAKPSVVLSHSAFCKKDMVTPAMRRAPFACISIQESVCNGVTA